MVLRKTWIDPVKQGVRAVHTTLYQLEIGLPIIFSERHNTQEKISILLGRRGGTSLTVPSQIQQLAHKVIKSGEAILLVPCMTILL